MQRIAFFGGSFDPPHCGHLAIAKAAAESFALDRVLFAPVARQPLKDNSTAATFLHRYAMTALATQVDPRFFPALLDAPQPNGNRPNYTVETLGRLRDSLPAASALFTLLGADSWLEIAQWHQPARLLALSDWIVAARPGFSLDAAEDALPVGVQRKRAKDSSGDFLKLIQPGGGTTRVYFLTSVWENVSATELRRALEDGQSTAGILPTPVEDYIRKTGLYGAGMQQIMTGDPHEGESRTA